MHKSSCNPVARQLRQAGSNSRFYKEVGQAAWTNRLDKKLEQAGWTRRVDKKVGKELGEGWLD